MNNTKKRRGLYQTLLTGLMMSMVVNYKYIKTRSILTFGFLPILITSLCSCSNDPSPKDAEIILKEKFLNSIQVQSIQETNAKEGKVSGINIYTMLFEARVKFLDDLVINPFEIKKGKLSLFSGLIFGNQVLKGQEAIVTGSIFFEDTKKGWMVSNIELQSIKDLTSEKFSGIWEYDYDNYGNKNYLKITKEKNGKYKLLTGYKYEGEIIWMQTVYGNADGIYLQFQNEKLQGEFVSPNFYATHGQEFNFRVTLDPIADNRMIYNIWCSIRGGETEKREAIKISD